jgi:hypothetical protein
VKVERFGVVTKYEKSSVLAGFGQRRQQACLYTNFPPKFVGLELLPKPDGTDAFKSNLILLFFT